MAKTHDRATVANRTDATAAAYFWSTGQGPGRGTGSKAGKRRTAKVATAGRNSIHSLHVSDG
ncbi:hypothetical protein [Sphingobacterium pedocola]|uniref:hypothetical protein n=1 Tax=Sphingobacterium pedocola TaxID=2082722 RepID=UPI0018CBA7C8|nr:hypothetical protein [Sphingobacterium pedocola]